LLVFTSPNPTNNGRISFCLLPSTSVILMGGGYRLDFKTSSPAQSPARLQLLK
jgi:hypothetical protein